MPLPRLLDLWPEEVAASLTDLGVVPRGARRIVDSAPEHCVDGLVLDLHIEHGGEVLILGQRCYVVAESSAAIVIDDHAIRPVHAEGFVGDGGRGHCMVLITVAIKDLELPLVAEAK